MEIAVEMGTDAPAGLNPYFYFVIFMLIGPPALAWKLGPPILNWIRARKAQRAIRGKGDPPSYIVSQAEIVRIGNDYKRISEAYKKIVEENEERDKRIDGLEEENAKEKKIRWDAISYIRLIIDSHRKHAPEAEIPAPPPSLQEIL